MGEWIDDKLYYYANDIADIAEFGRSEHAEDWMDRIGERVDMKRAMKALKIKNYWDASGYQSIADYLNGRIK